MVSDYSMQVSVYSRLVRVSALTCAHACLLVPAHLLLTSRSHTQIPEPTAKWDGEYDSVWELSAHVEATIVDLMHKRSGPGQACAGVQSQYPSPSAHPWPRFERPALRAGLAASGRSCVGILRLFWLSLAASLPVIQVGVMCGPGRAPGGSGIKLKPNFSAELRPAGGAGGLAVARRPLPFYT